MRHGRFFAGVLGVAGMGGVLRVLLGGTLGLVADLDAGVGLRGRGGGNGFVHGRNDRVRLRYWRRRYVGRMLTRWLVVGLFMIVMVVAIMFMMMLVLVLVFMGMIMRFMLMMFALMFALMFVPGLVRMRLVVRLIAVRPVSLEGLRLGRGVGACALDDLAADAVAMAAAA
jgi:hypothetical protein